MNMDFLYIVSVWLHVLSTAFWIGGMLFLVFILVPVIRRPELRERAPDLFRLTARRFVWAEWISFIVLVTTGVFNLSHGRVDMAGMTATAFWQSSHGRILAWKLILVAVIFLISAVHDFYWGPRATRVLEENPASEEGLRYTRVGRWSGRLNLLLGLAVVGFGVMLVRGWPS